MVQLTLQSLWRQFLKLRHVKVYFQAHGKKLLSRFKRMMKTYWKIIPQLVFSKTFDRVICISFYFLSSNLSLLLSQVSYQWICTLHNFCLQFMKFNSICIWQQCYCYCTVRDAFSDILKVSDKVWHDGFLFELKSFGGKGELLSLIEDCLKTMNKG